MDIPIPDDFNKRAKAQLGAYKKGWVAASEGKPCEHPYKDRRTNYNNGVTFSRGFIICWEVGWNAYHSHRKLKTAY